jgi:hypothetical protein
MKHFWLGIFTASTLLFPALPATANDFTIADYDRFQDLILKMRPIAADLANITNSPVQPGAEAAVRTQDCVIRLAVNFDALVPRFENIGTLVGLASRMAGDADLLLVTQLLSVNARGFLEQLTAHQQLLNATMQRCAQDGTAVAKGQGISRIYNEAGSLVQSVLNKVPAGARTTGNKG